MRLWFITLENKTVPLKEHSLYSNCAKPSVWSLDSPPEVVYGKALSLANVST